MTNDSKPDPNAIPWTELSCKGIGKAVEKVPLAANVVDFVCDRAKNRSDYMEYHVHLMNLIAQKNPDHGLILHFAAKITETASFGARRLNFRRAYIDGQTSGEITTPKTTLMRKLPSDPNDLMFGFW